MRVVLGPQDQHFTTDAKRLFLSAEFALTDAYDRMGVRLQGPALTIYGSLSMPSEPVLKGSVQVAGDGVPTVLLADHQTTGGYPKIATVLACDLDEFVQLRPRRNFVSMQSNRKMRWCWHAWQPLRIVPILML